jgi:outer membrane protein OmpA-like peptidoglycan-associated protein
MKGRINPFRENLFVDLHTTLTGLDLSPMTPYSGKYAGYTIEKGKLSLDLAYLIDRKELDSRNRVLIDQFNFGDSVESESATRLPVKFAVSLLKDAQGTIKIKLPVKGRTDDPEFSVLRIIGQILKNLIIKAASSPFALLESMYPGASELRSVEFAPGRSDLRDAELKKLGTLAGILADKPSLRLEISGYVDREQDRLGLAD